jgi:16S rRNA (guanine527-N7)-methyltransferase
MNVSHETIERLDRYAALVAEWNQKFNLIAESTLPHIWTRHFLDSAQLMLLIPKDARNLADMGSGAGFPGLVLSIMGMPDVHLIESIGKKAEFLRTVIRELNLDAQVHQERIENMHGLRVDVVTARALKPLPELLALAKHLVKKDSTALFLKGQSLEDELTESARSWKFGCKKVPSISDRSGVVLIVRNIQPTHAESRRKRK